MKAMIQEKSKGWRALSWSTLMITALLGASSCGEQLDEPEEGAALDGEEYISFYQALTPMCTVNVSGGGTMSVEDRYLPGVVACENGNADFEALKAQAIAARTFLKYKVDIERSSSIRNSQRDQVSSCGRTPTAEHIRAVQETRGQVMTYNGRILAAFYVSGVMPSTSNCIPSASDKARASSTNRNMEQYITINSGRSGGSVQPTSLGSKSSPYNRGAMSQNGSHCLATKGRDALSILRFYYGDDIRLEQLGGSCGGSAQPDNSPSQPEQSSPGNPQTPGSSGATDTSGSSASGGTSATGSSCVNGGILSNILPRSIWGATPPSSNRPAHTPNRITFHHTVQPAGVSGPSAIRQIQNWHKEAYGMADIGYHYVIDRDGTVYSGTPVDRVGAHQKGENVGNIGVAFIGSFGATSGPTSSQIQSAANLGLGLASQFGFNLNANSVLGGFLNGTAGQVIGSILNLLFGGGSGSSGSGLCNGSVNGSANNGISTNGGVISGTPMQFTYVRITASSTNTDPFPLDAIISGTSIPNQLIALDQVVESMEVEGADNITSAADGMGCTDLKTNIATIKPGGSVILSSNVFFGEPTLETGWTAKLFSAAEGVDLSSCMDPKVGGTVKIEVSADKSTWITAKEEAGMNTEFIFPSAEGNTTPSGGGSGGGTGGGTGGGGSSNGNLTPPAPENLGGNNGSGGASSGSANINTSLAERLAREALKNDGQRARGYCWKHVKQSAARAGLSGFGYSDPMVGAGPCSSYNYQLSAYCGGRNWNANPDKLKSWGFTKLNVHPTQAPRGSVIFWDKGCNGFHAVHGHVEIAVGGGRACSDYCGTIKSGGGSCSYVFAPTN